MQQIGGCGHHAKSIGIRLKSSLFSPNSLFQRACLLPVRHLRTRGSAQVEAKRGMQELLSLRPRGPASKREKLKPGKISQMLEVPEHIPRPPYVGKGADPPWFNGIQVHSEEGIVKMRAAGKLAAQVLEYAGTLVKDGVTTDEIDKAVHKMIIDNNAYPSPLTYGNFPKSVCTSVNECVCHGIPDSRPLQTGDIVNIDVTVFLNGYHGDTSKMFYVGEVSEKARRLCEVTKEALDIAIRECGPGVPVYKIGSKIHGLADKHGYGVVSDFVGHGVGWAFHSEPMVQHCRNNSKAVLEVGQTFTIEPMLTEGATNWKTWKDKWTIVLTDSSLCAQYEHTLLVTPNGVEILTLP